MCGIAGFVQRTDLETNPNTLTKMLSKLQHRGPDGHGEWQHSQSGWTIRLGHRRLSIIDLALGAQPLGAEDGRQITFNGEIFNFLELRPDLKDRGYQFKTESDTEVLLHHLDAHSDEYDKGLAKLNGMFAFAFWDPKRQELILARDHAGIKPLYYAPLPCGGLVFSSELSSLRVHSGVSNQISLRGIKSFFFSDYISPPETILNKVFKLSPGHFIVWRSGELSTPKSFWSLPSKNLDLDCSQAVLEQKLMTCLNRSIQRQLIADVPVGVFLSGGIDSSIVAALAQREIGKKPIKTFTIAFEEPDYDESLFAQKVADHIGSEHIVETLNQKLLLSSVEETLNCLDEPMADPSILPTYFLSRLAARHVKVVLGGDGGDELWAGYPTYKAHQWASVYDKIPSAMKQLLIHPTVSRLPLNLKYQSFEWKAKRFVLRWDNDGYRRHLRWMSATDLPLLKRMFPHDSKGPQILSELESMNLSGSNALLALDFQTYMSGSVLTKVDRASMAHGLEVRPPFLDTDFIEWAFSVPYDWKYRNRESKYLLKQVSKDLLPKEVVFRRKKGFGVPLARWLCGPLRERLRAALDSSPLWDTQLVSKAVFFECFNNMVAGKEDHSRTLWAFFVLDHWMKKEGLQQVQYE